MEQLFAVYCSCLGGAGMNSCCPHAEATVIGIFTPFFFRTTKKNEGLLSDIRRPDDQVPHSGGPLPSGRGEEVFRPVHHPGRRSEDRRRNMFNMRGTSQAEQSDRSQQEAEQEAARARQEAEREAARARRDATAQQQAAEEAARARREATARQQAAEEAAQREAREETARQEREGRERAQREQMEQEAREREQDAREREQEAREREQREEREREETERAQREERTQQEGDAEEQIQQAMQQGNTQTCYAASVCTLGARLGLHRCLQPEPASFESQQLHLAIISTFSAITDRSQARPSPEDIVRRLNLCLDPAGLYDERFDIMQQHCAGEFLHDFIGKGGHHEISTILLCQTWIQNQSSRICS